MIRINDLHKNFGFISILKGISLHIPKGEVVALIGPSGSGKSTLLRCINGLETATMGELFIEGENVLDPEIRKSILGKKIGMVFQHFHLFPHMTVLQNITYPQEQVTKTPTDVATLRAFELLERVELKDKAHAYPSQLSGGQKQRVAIARALAMHPEIILFDEPTSALDPEMVKEVLEVIRQLAGTGITMLIVTHEMNFAREVANRLLFLDQGQILEDTSPDTFFTMPSSLRAQEFLAKIL